MAASLGERWRKLAWTVTVGLGLLAAGPAVAGEGDATAGPPFRILWQMSWLDGETAAAPTAEELAACGIEPIPLITEGAIFGNAMPRYDQPLDLNAPALRAATDKIAAAAPAGGMVVLNVEKRGWMIKSGDPGAVRKADQYIRLIEHFRAQPAIQAKGLQLGYFGEAPINDYFGYIPGRGQVPATRATNWVTLHIARASDVLFPQMYTRYREPGSRSWIARAEGMMALIRDEWQPLIGERPVYPYLWPQYHDFASDLAIRRKLVEKGVFLTQLETLKRLGADGVVIWGTLGVEEAGERRARWAADMDWWVETKQFMAAEGYPECLVR